MAVGAVLMIICSWISIPLSVPFTLQIFALFFVLGLLGGKRGTISIVVYLLMGAVGIPVFSGFKGGIGVLAGPTGGYLISYIFVGLLYWLLEVLFGKKLLVRIIAMAAGLLVCYAFGTAWYMYLYIRQTGPVTLGTVLGWCVLPFIIPDILKIALALILTSRIRKSILARR